MTSRRFLWVLAALVLAAILAACAPRPASELTIEPVAATEAATEPVAEPPTEIPATEPAPAGAPTQAAEAQLPVVECGDVTLPQTAGPYYTPGSPERSSLLEPGITGTRLVLSGMVLTAGCQPVAGALLDFWHADDSGAYDNAGYRLRGHQFTDEAGRYSLETIYPGLYPGRTRHIHVLVQAPDLPTLTTQLYFPGEPQNATDGIFNPALVVDMQDGEDGKLAAFDFVLDSR